MIKWDEILTCPTLEERVKIGANLLDQWVPGWRLLLNPEIIDVGSYDPPRNPSNNSILGQLFDSYAKADRIIRENGWSRGKESWYTMGGFVPKAGERDAYEKLVSLWKKEIMIGPVYRFLNELNKIASNYRWGYVGDQYFLSHIKGLCAARRKELGCATGHDEEIMDWAMLNYRESRSIRAFLGATDPCPSICPLQAVTKEYGDIGLSAEEVEEITNACDARSWVARKRDGKYKEPVSKPFNRNLRVAIKSAINLI
jgi:hypothetical protein